MFVRSLGGGFGGAIGHSISSHTSRAAGSRAKSRRVGTEINFVSRWAQSNYRSFLNLNPWFLCRAPGIPVSGSMSLDRKLVSSPAAAAMAVLLAFFVRRPIQGLRLPRDRPRPRPGSVCLGFKSAFATRESNAISIEYGTDLENGFTYSVARASRKFPSQAHVRPRRCNRPSIHSTSAASKAATHSRTEEEGRKQV